MTGLDLETFLRLLRADLWVWVSLAVVLAILGLMAWASWGSRRALRKCLVASIMVHLGLVAFGGQTTWALRAFGPSGIEGASQRDRIRRIRVEPFRDDTAASNAESIAGPGGTRAHRPLAPWDQPGTPPLAAAMPPASERPRPEDPASAVVRRDAVPLDPLVMAPATPELTAPAEAIPPEARPATAAEAEPLPSAAMAPSATDLVDLPQVAAPIAERVPGGVPDLTAALRATGPGIGRIGSRPSARPPSVAMPPLELARAMPSAALNAPSGLPRASLPVRSLPDVPEVYRPRLEPNRAARAQAAGASSESEAAVERALAWLARHQDADGRWDAATARDSNGNPVPRDDDDFTVHCPSGDVCFGECHYWEADTALTGLALLSYLGAGYTHRDGKVHAATVEKGLRFLLSIQKPDGDLRGRSKAIGMYCHAMATLAISEAYALTGDERLRVAAERAVRFLVASRARDGMGWRYSPGDPVGDTSILGWVILVLKSAQENGLDVPATALEGANRWLKRVSSGKHGGLAAYQPGLPPSVTMTAEAWVCRQFLGNGGAGPASDEAAASLLSQGPARRPLNLYYWYYGTLALYQRGGEDWEHWNAQVRDELVRRQMQAGHASGSWDPSECKDRYDALGGRVYCTAVATLILEVYYRYQRLEGPSDEADPNAPPALAPARPADGGLRRAGSPLP